MLTVKQIFANSPLRNYTYIIFSNRSGEAVSIDPYDAHQIIDFVRKHSLKLKFILNTHEHNDHVKGNLELKAETGARVLSHPDATGKIPGLDDVLAEGDIAFSEEEEELIAWDTPGHTFCHLCFVVQSRAKIRALFSGDTLFNAGVGNCYRGGNEKVLFKTIKSRISTLPESVLLYPGHDYWESNLSFAKEVDPTNKYLTEMKTIIDLNHSEQIPFVSDLGRERKINPFFRLTLPEVQTAPIFSNLANKDRLDEEKAFLHLRSIRDKW